MKNMMTINIEAQEGAEIVTPGRGSSRQLAAAASVGFSHTWGERGVGGASASVGGNAGLGESSGAKAGAGTGGYSGVGTNFHIAEGFFNVFTRKYHSRVKGSTV